MRPAVVLLSGGLDSTTVLAMARSQGFAVHTLTVSYGQRHAVELEAAARVAAAYSVPHRVVEVDLGSFGGSALVGDGDVPKHDHAAELGDGIPSTYVPARNTVMLSIALAWAEVLGATDLFLGVSSVDYSGYPDCRPEYLEAFQAMARLATAAGVGGAELTVHAPLTSMSKADTISAGLALGVDYGLTHSCYDPSPVGRPCGRCDSCLLRAKGFAEAGADDPLLTP